MSFDVVSLFTNVPLKRTLEVILRRVYKEKQISTSLKKSTLKKLLIDTCTKTAFTFNDKFYEQIDGVSMGGSLGPLLANIIMTEMEKNVVRKLIDDGTIRFYTRFVDDTLLLIKEEDIDRVKNEFENFDKNLKFTYEKFENENPHFLDIEITSTGLKIYRKDTFTGHYTDFSSFVPWNHRISWIRSLVYRTKRLCDPRNFKDGIKDVNKFASWNGFPRYIRKKLISKFINESETTRPERKEDPDVIPVWINFPYIGSTGDNLVKTFKKKFNRFLNPKKKIKINSFFNTTKLTSFTSTKDKTPKLMKSSVVYEVSCPGCGESYIGKTERILKERTKEHAFTDKESPMQNHLQHCQHFLHLHGMISISDDLFSDDIEKENGNITHPSYARQVLENRIKILDNDQNWNRLLYKEALAIERKGPSLNQGLKASRQLKLFR